MTLQEPDLLAYLQTPGLHPLLLLLLLPAGLAVAYLLLRRRPAAPGPLETALRALDALASPDPVMLSRILRTYLEQRFGIPALKQITEETLESLRRCIPDGRMERLSFLLFRMDRAKFGPEPDRIRLDADAVRAFVREDA